MYDLLHIKTKHGSLTAAKIVGPIFPAKCWSLPPPVAEVGRHRSCVLDSSPALGLIPRSRAGVWEQDYAFSVRMVPSLVPRLLRSGTRY